jgi:menaquinone-dependent protoporphyrinogen IX oxidase
MKILIIYGTRFGATQTVAEYIYRNLNKNNQIDLKNIIIDPIENLKSYDGIIIGSSIVMGNFTKEINHFLKENKNLLNKKVFGFYVCSGKSITHQKEANIEYCKEKLEKLGIKTKIHSAVGAIFDFSKKKKTNFLQNLVLKMVSKEINDEIDYVFDYSKKNDLIKYYEIDNFIKLFENSLNK